MGAQLQIDVERPPPGLQRGRYPAPQWVILAVGATVVLGAVVVLIWRARRTLRSRERGGPRSSRRG
ncbi:hypothetical protein BE20_13000 [Sorangium cellulosum]|uniref:Uncharacterized protein n=1 Tax=Sorangium cellulosum TaxID=56 RepID=A0A150SHW6_SORCE|nr:hypothetical protein BE20_13000 [Sorangium cellulosum]KYF95885.1 hypothetical protein BE18_46280 [Sorangium cellulosum]